MEGVNTGKGEKRGSIKSSSAREATCVQGRISTDSPFPSLSHTHTATTAFALLPSLCRRRRALEALMLCLSCLTGCLLLFNTTSCSAISRWSDATKDGRDGDKCKCQLEVGGGLLLVVLGVLSSSPPLALALLRDRSEPDWIRCCTQVSLNSLSLLFQQV